MGTKRVLITYGVDVDAVAGWLGSYGGEDSTNDISRGKCVCFGLLRSFLTRKNRSMGWNSWDQTSVEDVC